MQVEFQCHDRDTIFNAPRGHTRTIHEQTFQSKQMYVCTIALVAAKWQLLFISSADKCLAPTIEPNGQYY